MTMAGGPSSGTVTMNYGAVSGAGEKMVQYGGEITNALQALNTALGPVRETWYNSGSTSGAEAQAAESNLRGALVGIAEIIGRIGQLLGNSAVSAADLDNSLGNGFRNGGQSMGSSSMYA
jgi:uncharacterized protein YukE